MDDGHLHAAWPAGVHRLTLSRRDWWPAAVGLLTGVGGGAAAADGGRERRVLAPRALAFPGDHGSHNDTQTEWWYLTGWLRDEHERLLGFQLTFFRSRVASAQKLRSRLAAKQLLLAHAALTDVAGQRLLHAQAVARWDGVATPVEEGGAGRPGTGPAVWAAARADELDVCLGDWRMRRDAQGGYHVALRVAEQTLTLVARPTQALLLQGQRGWSRKGPEPSQASFYYSQPQLQVSGQWGAEGQARRVQGRAWLDHEWSETFLAPEAVGWDWIGINLDDGSCLTAFRLRRAQGSAPDPVWWAGGSWRGPASAARTLPDEVFAPGDVRFEPLSDWRSPRTGIRYPVQWRVTTPRGRWQVRALLADQELDSRRSTGAVYWEGLSECLDERTGRRVGLGYLEMTGYGEPIRW